MSIPAKPDLPLPQSREEADIFSRGGIQMTFTLLRRKSPELALTVRNILGDRPLDKSENDINSPNSDLFKVSLPSCKVRAVVENLVEVLNETRDPSLSILAQTLLDDWIALANLMIDRSAGLR